MGASIDNGLSRAVNICCLSPATYARSAKTPSQQVCTGNEPNAWRIHLGTATELEELAACINPIVRGERPIGQVLPDGTRPLAQAQQHLPDARCNGNTWLCPFRNARRWWKDLTAWSEGRLSRSDLREPRGEILRATWRVERRFDVGLQAPDRIAVHVVG